MKNLKVSPTSIIKRIILAPLAIGAIAIPMLAMAPAAEATSTHTPTYQLTVVARVCPTYADVQANKARNDIMESLRDLGHDTGYARHDSVVPAKEDAGAPNCHPLENWDFTLGTGYKGKSAATHQLSTVTGAFSTQVTTGKSTPMLNNHGVATGATIPAATTITLTADQVRHATHGQRLWVQGGHPTAPLNGRGTELGYGALRCSSDALNGDNVEYVTYPNGVTHAYCYYYAVQPPPTAGEIIVTKKVTDGAHGTSHATFTGTVPFGDSDGDGVNDFTLAASNGHPDSVTYIRGAVGAHDPEWTITEAKSADWALKGNAPVCTSRDGSSGITYTDRGVSIKLAGSDRVNCTYTNTPVPQPEVQKTPTQKVTATPTPHEVVEPPKGPSVPTPDVQTPLVTPDLVPSPQPTTTPGLVPARDHVTPGKVPTAVPSENPTAVPNLVPNRNNVTPGQVPTAVPSENPTAVPNLVPNRNNV
ncbi:prealbumin-like fold domain-containing protein, partial [Demequina aurantiaca]|uniref:prealbumin-like fold domain-containing protein n=1 Tax=Demequina aurantiaca TaxID=676200 RepID=UPI003F722C31